MRYLLAIIILLTLGCSTKEITSLKCPIVVIAKSEGDRWYSATMVIEDGNGHTKSLHYSRTTDRAYIDTYDIGDTIKPCKYEQTY